MILPDFETTSPIIFYLLCKYRFRHWKRSDIEKYQYNKLQKVTSFAFNRSPFFQSYYQNRNLADFTSLPTVNKKLMMDNFSNYNTLNFKKEELVNFALEMENKRDFSSRFHGFTIGMSSGTSGNKGIIVTSKHEEHYLKALYFSRLILPKEKLTCAFILRVNSPAFNFNFLGNSLTYINQLQPTEKIVSQIEEIQPNVISAPPSILKILAKEKS